MINELIENERKRLGLIELHKSVEKEDVLQSMKNIAKEVAMRFIKNEQQSKYFDLVGEDETSEVCFDMSIGYNRCVHEINNLADQIINEVSPHPEEQ